MRNRNKTSGVYAGPEPPTPNRNRMNLVYASPGNPPFDREMTTVYAAPGSPLFRKNAGKDSEKPVYPENYLEDDTELEDETVKFCSKCGKTNPMRAQYCCECGAPFPKPKVICPSCGKKNLMGWKFCIFCGKRISDGPVSRGPVLREVYAAPDVMARKNENA